MAAVSRVSTQQAAVHQPVARVRRGAGGSSTIPSRGSRAGWRGPLSANSWAASCPRARTNPGQAFPAEHQQAPLTMTDGCASFRRRVASRHGAPDAVSEGWPGSPRSSENQHDVGQQVVPREALQRGQPRPPTSGTTSPHRRSLVLGADPPRELGDHARRASAAQRQAEQVGTSGTRPAVPQFQHAGRRRRESSPATSSSKRPTPVGQFWPGRGWPRTSRRWRTPSSAAGARNVEAPQRSSASSRAGPRMPGPTVTRDDGTSRAWTDDIRDRSSVNCSGQ